MKLTTKQLKQIIKEELEKTLKESNISPMKNKILKLLGTNNDKDKITAVVLAKSLKLPEFAKAKEDTVNYLHHALTDQRSFDRTWQPNKQLDEALANLKNIKDPAVFMKEYKKITEKHKDYNLNVKILPAYPDEFMRDLDSGLMDVFDKNFLNLHYAYYLEGALEGLEVHPEIHQWAFKNNIEEGLFDWHKSPILKALGLNKKKNLTKYIPDDHAWHKMKDVQKDLYLDFMIDEMEDPYWKREAREKGHEEAVERFFEEFGEDFESRMSKKLDTFKWEPDDATAGERSRHMKLRVKRWEKAHKEICLRKQAKFLAELELFRTQYDIPKMKAFWVDNKYEKCNHWSIFKKSIAKGQDFGIPKSKSGWQILKSKQFLEIAIEDQKEYVRELGEKERKKREEREEKLKRFRRKK